MSLKISIGGDHAGFLYKQEVIGFLQSKGHEVKDFGPFSESSVDYPDFAHPLANSVESKESDFGILICGSGNGVAITANKHKAIRAALCWNREIAKLSREHNNSNVLCLPSRFMSLEEAKASVELYLNTPFEGGRHQSRVDKISHC
jgi:ribose 5-phosphate isomerase B